MAWWKFWKRRGDLDPQVRAIFEKLSRFLVDEAAQNDMLPEPFRSLVVNGAAVDRIAHGFGEFGFDLNNPIPVNGPLGEILYLSSLLHDSGEPLLIHRLGSIGKVDVFETVTFDGKHWELFYLDLYHPRKSRVAPKGYRFGSYLRGHPLFRGTTAFVPDFPRDLYRQTFDWSKLQIGIGVLDTSIRGIEDRVSFARPAKHAAFLETLRPEGRVTFGVADPVD